MAKRNGKNGVHAETQTNHYRMLREFKPKTVNQAAYVRAIAGHDIIICTGPAGTGKTAVAVGIACEHLVFGKTQKLVLSRPVVEAGRGIGYLPGTANEKLHPYVRPLLDELNCYVEPYEIQQLITKDVVEIAPLEYMRGRNFHNSFMILDEGQNATLEQIKMFLTRLGRSSKCIITGDVRQSDLARDGQKIGLQLCLDRLQDLAGVALVELTVEDIVRNPIISSVLARLEQTR